jgi:Asp-tRNA(Asn)/Glu-tRNA(Gln) amidotransferase A subunit family amidase
MFFLRVIYLILTARSSLNTHSVWGSVINPLSADGIPRSAGGSSGGSAAAVAADIVEAYVAVPPSFL